MPRYFLLQNGINPEKDFAKFSFSGAHDATALWVESGKVEAGALNEAVRDKLVQTKKVDPNKVKVFWTTPPYIDYVWTVRGDLDGNLVEKIAAAFTKLNYNNLSALSKPFSRAAVSASSRLWTPSLARIL